MLPDKTIEQIEKELNKAAQDAKEKRIRQVEEKLNEKARSDKKR